MRTTARLIRPVHACSKGPASPARASRALHPSTEIITCPAKSPFDLSPVRTTCSGFHCGTAINAFYGRSGPTALDPRITAMTWARFFDDYEPVHALVADRGGELLGLTHYLFHRSTTAIEPTCYLQDLFTGEAARGKGVGRALIKGVYAQAQLARIVPRLLADARNQPHGDAALRQGRRPLRLRGVPQAVLIAFEGRRRRLWISPDVTGA